MATKQPASKQARSRSGSSGRATRAAQAKAHQASRTSDERSHVLDERTKRDIASVALIVIALALLATVIVSPEGVVTGALSMALRYTLGIGVYVLPILLIILAITLLIRFEREMVPTRVAIGFALLFIAFLSIVGLFTPGAEAEPNVIFAPIYLVSHGGYIGAGVAWAALNLFGLTVSTILMAGLIIIAFIIIGFSLSSLYERIRCHYDQRAEMHSMDAADSATDKAPRVSLARIRRGRNGAIQTPAHHNPIHEATTQLMGNDSSAADTVVLNHEKSAGLSARPASSDVQATQVLPVVTAAPKHRGHHRRVNADTQLKADASPGAITRKLGSRPVEAVPTNQSAPTGAKPKTTRKSSSDTVAPKPSEGFELPSMDLLNTTKPSEVSRESEASLRNTGALLQETLADFGVNADVVGWVHGPTVTLFKVDLPSGVRVNRVSNLTDDIALALAAPGVRIFAPVPGTNYVGIEVPNKKRETVLLGDVIKDAPAGPLQVAIGRDVEGNNIVSDLAKMPHLLIGGTTGSGKSVSINAMIMSILMRATPSEVRMIMIDPKRVEFTPYNGIPHLYVPVVTEAREAASALSWAVAEMERRLKIFSSIGARNIGQYNAKVQQGVEINDAPGEEMPYIVIVIDELADLMMNVGKEVEFSISRLAQLARAAGIHLIVATQRPSTNVVTGLIKANITNRIAFNVASGIDSRVILDTPGAENLIGLGDLLLSKPELAKPQRIQGCFVSEDEIAAVVEKLKTQGEPEYHNDILKTNLISLGDSSPDGSGGTAHSSDDPLVWEAADIVVSTGVGSTSNLQRRLSVGYSRAGRIMDLLEAKGIVGPPRGSKPREVLVDALELETLRAFEENDSQ